MSYFLSHPSDSKVSYLRLIHGTYPTNHQYSNICTSIRHHHHGYNANLCQQMWKAHCRTYSYCFRMRKAGKLSHYSHQIKHKVEVHGKIKTLPLSAQSKTSLHFWIGITYNSTVIFCDISVTIQILELDFARQSSYA